MERGVKNLVIYSDNCSGVFMGGVHKVPFPIDHIYTVELCITIRVEYNEVFIRFVKCYLYYFISRIHDYIQTDKF